ncbi:hypothetical protein ABVT39_028119 [Epinephelus coioides]
MAKTTKQLQMVNNLLKSNYQNFTLLQSEYGPLRLLINATRYNFTLLSAEKTRLSLLLMNTLQEKTQMQMRQKKEPKTSLNSTLENCDLVEEENRQLDLPLNESFDIVTMVSAESKQLHGAGGRKSTPAFSPVLQQTVLPFKILQQEQIAVFMLPAWFVQQLLRILFHSAVRISLYDMVEDCVHKWVSGNKIHKDFSYWKPLEPSNAGVSWDKDWARQHYVAIILPRHTGQEDWLNSWDDIVCGGKQRYLCKTVALSLS